MRTDERETRRMKQERREQRERKKKRERERAGRENSAEEALAATTFDWLAGLAGFCGTVLLHTYSARRTAVVAFIYRRLLLSGASAAF